MADNYTLTDNIYATPERSSYNKFLWNNQTGQQEQEPGKLVTAEDEEVLASDGTNEQKLAASLHYLQDQYGFSKAGASGFLACLNASSHMKLGAANKQEKNGQNGNVNKNQYGIGIMQWTHGRHDDFLNYVKNNGGKADLKTQLDFGMTELARKPELLAKLQSIENPEDAAAYTWACFMAEQNKVSTLDTKEKLYKKVASIVEKKRRTYNGMGYKYNNGWTKRQGYANEIFAMAKNGTKLPSIDEINNILNQ